MSHGLSIDIDLVSGRAAYAQGLIDRESDLRHKEYDPTSYGDELFDKRWQEHPDLDPLKMDIQRQLDKFQVAGYLGLVAE